MPEDDHWLLLHGTPLSPEIWDEVAELLQPYGTVSCPDVTPHQMTSGPTQTLAGRLKDQLPDDARVHVVGHSFGGQVALDLALGAPFAVRSLTVICSRDTPYPPCAQAAEALRRGDPVDVEAALARWFGPAELAADGPLVGYARRCVEQADRAAWAEALQAVAEYDRSDRSARLDLPVTLVAAEHDTVSTPVAMNQLAGRLVNAELVQLADAWPLSPFSDPARLVELIRGTARRSRGALTT
ncbi:MAG: alpha/beta fold hydrolase [Propionibacteriaceae bacterium]